MSRFGGEVEFDFVGDGSEGNFVATAKVLPMLVGLLAKGEVEAAMRLFEGSDASVAQELLLQVTTMSSASLKNLGNMFVLARDFTSGAKVMEAGKRYADAAALHEQGSDFVAAARCYEKVGNLAQAAAAMERAGKPDQALELYRRTEPSEAMAQCMVRQHLYWEASFVYQQLANVRGEVESLRLVPVTSPNRLPAVKRLGDLLERFGHLAPAAQLLAETLQQVGAAQGDRELLVTLVRRLEALGKHDHADKVRAFAQKRLASGAPQAQAQAHAPQAQAPERAPSATLAVVPRMAPADPFASPADPFAAPSAPKQELIPKDPFADLVDPFGGAAGGGAGAQPAVQVRDGYGQLKAIPIFGELALPDMKDLHRISEANLFREGTTLIEQGVQGTGLFVILQGSVEVLRVDGAKQIPLATLGAGSYVGELSLLDDAPTSAKVVAKSAVRALIISRPSFQKYLYTHEAAALRIFMLFTRTLAERLRQANKRA